MKRGVVKTSNRIHLEAAGGVLSQTGSLPLRILLIKRNGFWDLPKGKREEGEVIESCAVREVKEETGVNNINLLTLLCKTYHEYEREGKYFGKTTYWFEMTTPQVQNFIPQKKEGITDVAWFAPEQASDLVHFTNLKTVIDTFLVKKRRDEYNSSRLSDS